MDNQLSEPIFKINQPNCPNFEPLLELYKGKLFSNLIKLFTNDCITQLGTHIFSIKKFYSRTLTNLLSCWIFSLYIDYDFTSDYFLPTNYSNTDILKNILKDLCKYDLEIINPDYKINKILANLKTNYKKQLDLLEEYSHSYIFKNNKNNYKIKKSMININKNKTKDIESTFYKFDISVQFVVKDKRLSNVISNILLPVNIHDKLVTKYTGPPNKINEYLWAIVFRYQLLGSNNHQLAVLPTIMNQMKINYSLGFECFASAINSNFNNYCSIYYDLERYFGSVGSFFNIEPLKGTFGFNPPYQKDIIERGIHKLFEHLTKAINKLTFIITIPIWDIEGRLIMKEKYNNELEKQNIDYGDFTIISIIKSSQFYRGLRMIPKEEFTYIDHNFELYKNKTIQNTYVIILSNGDVDLTYLDNYDFASLPVHEKT